MGDRSLIIVKSESMPQNIVFYGHWAGEDNYRAVENAMLSPQCRVGDPSYLCSQIFYHFTKLGGYDGGTGFGMWTAEEGDDEGWTDNPTVYVNADTGIVTYQDEEINFQQKMLDAAIIHE